MNLTGTNLTCVEVRRNKDGDCACARYLPTQQVPPNHPDYRTLCRDAGLPFKINGELVPPKKNTNVGGLPPSKYSGEHQMNDMDFPALEDLAQTHYGQDFFDGIMDAAALKRSIMAGLAGGGGILVSTNLVEWIGRKAAASTNTTVQALAQPWSRSLMTMLVGIAGGRLVWMANEKMAERKGDNADQTTAIAFMGATVGLGLAKLVSAYVPGDWNVVSALSAAEVARVPPDEFFSATRGPVGEGFNQVDVTRDAPLALSALALGSPEVEVDELSALGSWIG